MSRTIPSSHGSSIESGHILILRPRRSGILTGYWWGVHALAGIAISSLPGSLWLNCFILGGLLGHLFWRWPARAPLLIVNPKGEWAAPTLGLTGLRPGSASSYGTWWIRLSLVGPGQSLHVLLISDQLDGGVWRRLRATLARQSRN